MYRSVPSDIGALVYIIIFNNFFFLILVVDFVKNPVMTVVKLEIAPKKIEN